LKKTREKSKSKKAGTRRKDDKVKEKKTRETEDTSRKLNTQKK